jgi:hypothetical protein
MEDRRYVHPNLIWLGCRRCFTRCLYPVFSCTRGIQDNRCLCPRRSHELPLRALRALLIYTICDRAHFFQFRSSSMPSSLLFLESTSTRQSLDPVCMLRYTISPVYVLSIDFTMKPHSPMVSGPLLGPLSGHPLRDANTQGRALAQPNIVAR